MPKKGTYLVKPWDDNFIDARLQKLMQNEYWTPAPDMLRVRIWVRIRSWFRR